MATAPEMTEQSMLEEAQRYLARGLPVFPICTPRGVGECEQHGSCPNAGKRPLVKWEAFQQRLPVEQELTSWWRKWPTANIGMATGKLPGVVVLDADGAEARKEALRRGLPMTPALWTGKPGGAHFWFAHPGVPVRNFARKLPGIDFRGDGGYVLLPPSLHASGARYRWEERTVGQPLAPLPSWLGDLLAGRMPAEPQPTNGTATDHLDLMGFLDGVPEGGRDDALWRLASKLRADDLPRPYAEWIIRQAARLCRPSFDETIAVEKVARAYRQYAPDPTWDVPTETKDADSDPFAQPPPEPWAVYDAATLLAKEYPPIAWRIDGWAREDALVWCFGPPGAIKTYIATDAALAAATGGLFLGRFSAQPSTVLVIQEDTQESDYVQEYLRPMVAARGIAPSVLAERFFVAPPAGMRFDVAERLIQLGVWLAAYRPQFVVLDAWYLLQGDAEGYGKEQRRIIGVLRAIRRQYGGVWWIVDHNRKGGKEGGNDEQAVDRLFGGREKSAAADAVLEVRPIKGAAGQVFLDVVKMRGAKPTEGIALQLVDGLLTIAGQRPETLTGAAEDIHEWLCREGGSRTKKQIQHGTGLSERSVDTACSTLLMLGRVRENGLSGRAKTYLAIFLKSDDGTEGSLPW